MKPNNLVSLFIVAAGLIALFACIKPMNDEERCERAKIRVEVHEKCGADTNCYLTSNDRDDLIRAKTDVWKWCGARR